MTIQRDPNYCFLYNQLQQSIQKMDKQLTFEGESMVTIKNFEQDAFQSTVKETNVPTTTAQESHSMQEERFYQKEDINSEDSFQISFDKCFMTQHSAVLSWELKKYMESVQTYLQENNKNILELFPNGFDKQDQQGSCQQLIQQMKTQILPELKGKLLNETKTNDKLQQMLDIVAKICPPQMAIQLIRLSGEILEEYLKCIDNTVGLLDLFFLMNLAFEKSKKLEHFHTLDLSFMASSSLQYRKLMLKYQKFMQIYCVTTILVVAQFFQNPYFEKQMTETPKRPLRQFEIDDNIEMEEQVDIKPQKKRKSSK